MLLEKITEDMKVSMKAGESEKVTTLRSLISELKKWKIDNPGKDYNEEIEIQIVRKCLKQRNDSIKSYKEGGREDLANEEKIEAEIIGKYLPQMMSEDEVEKVVLAKKEALGISDKSGMGQLMGACMGEIKGKADGSVVKQVVEKVLV